MSRFAEAQSYTGGTQDGGVFVAALVASHGICPQDKILDVGCGMLFAGKFLMQLVDVGNYHVIEPNAWLYEASLSQDSQLRAIVDARKPKFSNVSNFDAAEMIGDDKYDIVFAYSILSHAAHWQLEQFLVNTSKHLAATGVIVVAMRLAEYDTKAAEWVYPDVSFFRRITVSVAARKAGLFAKERPSYRRLFESYNP